MTRPGQCATWWWLFISLHTYGGLASGLAVLAIVGLAGFLALYHAVVCAVFVRLSPVYEAAHPTRHSALRPLVFAALWLLAELGRVAFFTGFPWGEGGYAQLDGPFANLAKLVGVHGLTFASAWVGAAALGLALRPRWPSALRVAAVLALAGGVSVALKVDNSVSLFTSTHPAVVPGSSPQAFTVALLQGNIAQDEKFLGGSGIPDALKWYGEQLRRRTGPGLPEQQRAGGQRGGRNGDYRPQFCPIIPPRPAEQDVADEAGHWQRQDQRGNLPTMGPHRPRLADMAQPQLRHFGRNPFQPRQALGPHQRMKRSDEDPRRSGQGQARSLVLHPDHRQPAHQSPCQQRIRQPHRRQRVAHG